MHHIYSQRAQHKHPVVPKTENSEIPRVSTKDMIILGYMCGARESVCWGGGYFYVAPVSWIRRCNKKAKKKNIKGVLLGLLRPVNHLSVSVSCILQSRFGSSVHASNHTQSAKKSTTVFFFVAFAWVRDLKFDWHLRLRKASLKLKPLTA